MGGHRGIESQHAGACIDRQYRPIIKLIIENPGILQRPIVEVGDKAVLARPIEKALELIKR